MTVEVHVYQPFYASQAVAAPKDECQKEDFWYAVGHYNYTRGQTRVGLIMVYIDQRIFVLCPNPLEVIIALPFSLGRYDPCSLAGGTLVHGFFAPILE